MESFIVRAMLINFKNQSQKTKHQFFYVFSSLQQLLGMENLN